VWEPNELRTRINAISSPMITSVTYRGEASYCKYTKEDETSEMEDVKD